jgi:predicted ATP-dependent Lon-type protease
MELQLWHLFGNNSTISVPISKVIYLMHYQRPIMTFLDRIHAICQAEVQKLRNDMFTSDYGFIVDYLAEILMSYKSRTNEYSKYFELSDNYYYKR